MSSKIKKFDKLINYYPYLLNYEKAVFNYFFFNINKKKFGIHVKDRSNILTIFLFMFIPFQIEIENVKIFYSKKNIFNYIKNIFWESKKISDIKKKYFEKNLFYTEKWNIKYLFLKFKLVTLGLHTNNSLLYVLIKFIFLICSTLVFLYFYLARLTLFIKIITLIKNKKTLINRNIFT